MKKAQITICLFASILLNVKINAQPSTKEFPALAQAENESQVVYFKKHGTKMMQIDRQKSVINLKSPETSDQIFRRIKLFPNNLDFKILKVHLMSDHLFDDDDEFEFILTYHYKNDSIKIDLFKTSPGRDIFTIKRLAQGIGNYNIKLIDKFDTKKLEIKIGNRDFNYELKKNFTKWKNPTHNTFIEVKTQRAKFINPFSWEKGKIEILIFSNKGSLVKAQKKSSRKSMVTIKTNKIPNGKYICQIRNKLGIAQTHFFEIYN